MIIKRSSQNIYKIFTIVNVKNKSQSITFFSTSESPKAPQAATPATQQKVHNFTSEHIITQDKLSKDLRYQEQAYKFNREWKKIAEAKNEEQI